MTIIQNKNHSPWGPHGLLSMFAVQDYQFVGSTTANDAQIHNSKYDCLVKIS
jgi:hypothetical protein